MFMNNSGKLDSEAQDRFFDYVCDMVATEDGYECMDGEVFSAFDQREDGEFDDSDVIMIANAAINHEDELRKTGSHSTGNESWWDDVYEEMGAF